jgi:nucleotidyltransferase substrate binding protein (TIGR01987 family)
VGEMKQDIRWKQRFSNFERALSQLKQGIENYPEDVEAIIKEGVIQRFEFTHELAWKVLKDYLDYEGLQNVTGSRSASRLAFNIGLIDDGQVWMDMIESRNKTMDTYQESILEQEYAKVRRVYYPSFVALQNKMQTLL